MNLIGVEPIPFPWVWGLGVENKTVWEELCCPYNVIPTSLVCTGQQLIMTRTALGLISRVLRRFEFVRSESKHSQYLTRLCSK